MKVVFVLVLFALGSTAFGINTDALKTKVTEVKKKACPVVNGKEDCSVKEVKEKALDLKSKLMK